MFFPMLCPSDNRLLLQKHSHVDLNVMDGLLLDHSMILLELLDRDRILEQLV
jgi:hypothetical protein